MREYQYDPLQRIKTIADKDPAGNKVMHYAYTHDAMDNITQKVTGHGIYGYDYDDLYRLIDVTNPAAVGANEAYTYDAVGNRITSADVTGDWQYNDNNELQSRGDVTYNYDENGSMIEKSVGGVVTRFFYNLENRLERVEDGGGSVIAIYYYDPFGRRLWKDVGGNRIYFHYSDEGLVGEYDNGGDEIKTYGYKPGSTWSTDPLFMKVGADYYFYHNDHLGTPQKMTRVNGGVVWGARYTAFGEAVVDLSSTVESGLRFAGQYYDSETGLHYNGHRYYDPKLGRYLRSDPSFLKHPRETGVPYLLPLMLYKPSELNGYSYVQNNPISLNDPFGLASCNGNWRYAGSDRLALTYCVCYWLCIPCQGSVIWSGDPKQLPNSHKTFGTYIWQGGGGLEDGDRCFCKKPGPEENCDECPKPPKLNSENYPYMDVG